MQHGYRRFSWLSDLGGIKTSLGEMIGLAPPPQPRLHRRPPASVDEAWLTGRIRAKAAHHPLNAMEYPFPGERIFEEPLIGFVRGDDPLFGEFKRIVGPQHFTPEEILAWQAHRNGVAPPTATEIGVVAYVLPLTERTRQDNAAAQAWLSERWAQTRLLGEIFSQTLMREIVTELMDQGILAVAPDSTPMFKKKKYPSVGWASPWSHRHIGYAAGLGTFGKHDFFITEKGCAHRMGSLVVHLPLKPNRTRPEDIHAFCLAYQGKPCMRCAARCPAGAISEAHAHDKNACAARVSQSLAYCNRNYHIFIYGCGLCATGVPCAAGIPTPLRDTKEAL